APFLFGLGLDGLLLFNVLLLALAAAGAALFAHGATGGGARGGATGGGARAHDPTQSAPTHAPGATLRAAAALTAALVFVAGTGVFRYAYSYHADTTLLGLWLAGLAALMQGRGAVAGVLLALTVGLKPTALLWFPSLVLLALDSVRGARGWARLRALRTPLGAGAATLAAVGAVNAWVFGRPWYTGYTRTLIREGGELRVTANLELFNRELLLGLESNWEWLSAFFPVMALAIPGLLALCWRRPLVALAAAVGLVLTELVFAVYVYEGDRFHWPALALCLPALAESVRLLGQLVIRCGRRRRAGPRTGEGFGAGRRALAGGLLAVLGFAWAIAASDHPLEAHLGRGPTYRAAAFAASGQLSAGDDLTGLRSDARTELSQSRLGPWPRTPLLPAVLLAPAVAFGDDAGLLAFLLCLGLFGAGLARAAPAGSPPPGTQADPVPGLAIAAAALLYAWPLPRGPLLERVPELLGVAALLWASSVAAARGRRRDAAVAGLLVFLGLAALEAPVLALAFLPL
ncbi:MAG: hypothetical protein AAF447_28655, partial [Myxococcota bacterium]